MEKEFGNEFPERLPVMPKGLTILWHGCDPGKRSGCEEMFELDDLVDGKAVLINCN